jgi:hypothetical protein
VAIPVRNEEETLAACLMSLDRLDGRASLLDAVLLVLNQCSDRSWRTANAWAARHDLPLHVVEVELREDRRHAGGARACALHLAATAVAGHACGIVLSTDADSQVPTDWLTRAVKAIDGGLDVVAGDIRLADAARQTWPLAFQQRSRDEDAYTALLDEIDALCDPVPHNPWPAHRRCSGANLAFRASVLLALAPLPAPPSGEDRALVEACLARDGRVRHDPFSRVDTSARLEGRAPGGMADTLSQRMAGRDLGCDRLLEPCPRHVLRAQLRARARRLFVPGMTDAALAAGIGLPFAHPPSPCAYFGEAWPRLEAAASALRREPLVPRDLPWEIGEAQAWLSLHRRAQWEQVA